MSKLQDYTYKNKSIEVRTRTIEDYKIFLEAYNSLAPSQRKYDKGFEDMTFATKDWFEAKVKLWDSLAARDVAYLFGIFRLSDGKMVGYCDLATQYREDYQIGMVGYAVFNPYWENGYAKEAVETMIHIGFNLLGYHRLEAHINLDNEISKKVVLSSGFKFEGIREKYIRENDVWTDHEVYILINPKDSKS
jgi:ribosomal-protein-alanine N-acetyltransferase